MKNWYKSRVIWLAIVTGVAGVVFAFSEQYPNLGILLTATSVLNMILRFLTIEPIK